MTDRIVVVGQGYVGLPLAVRAVEVGYDVIGYDVDPHRVGRLHAGDSFVEDVSAEQLKAAMDSGRFKVTMDSADIADFDIAIITVPTPLRDSAPDLSYIEQAAAELGRHLKAGATVVLESTTYPGTTEELLVPILEEHSGLTAPVDFHAGYSPERIDPGNKTYRFENTPKVVSGIDESSLKVIADFYDRLITEVVPVPTPKEAELTKLLENTFRHVNIALVNELAVYASDLGIDVWAAIDAASTKPFGFMKFTPGPGVGGHCLPIDPSYLSWRVKQSLGHSFRFVELANDVNEHMPAHVVTRITGILNAEKKAVNGSNIMLLGLAYKKNSGDHRETPVLPVANDLISLGATVSCHDTWVDPARWPEHITQAEVTEESLKAADLVVLLTDHDDVDYELIKAHAPVIFDTRNRLTGEQIVKL